MKDLIAHRRFNYVDATGMGAATALLSQGRWGWAAVTLVVFGVLSFIVEH